MDNGGVPQFVIEFMVRIIEHSGILMVHLLFQFINFLILLLNYLKSRFFDIGQMKL